MRGRHLCAIGALMALLSAGCAHNRAGGGLARARTPAEPLYDDPAVMAEAAPAPNPPAVAIVDRHPLLSKPREYYENSGENKLVKVGAATVIGIPAGILGEMRQIVVGQPRSGRY